MSFYKIPLLKKKENLILEKHFQLQNV